MFVKGETGQVQVNLKGRYFIWMFFRFGRLGNQPAQMEVKATSQHDIKTHNDLDHPSRNATDQHLILGQCLIYTPKGKISFQC